MITELGGEVDGNLNTLQNMHNNLAGNYVLGKDIDASATNGWNSGVGFLPIGQRNQPFTGTLDGLGHSINKIFINQPGEDDVGVIGTLTYGSVRNISATDVSITGRNNVGGLIGAMRWGSSLKNSYSSGTVKGTPAAAGAVVLPGASSGSEAAGIGGLVGAATPYAAYPSNGSSYCSDCIRIDGGASSANVYGNIATGGLIGFTDQTRVKNSYAAGNVNGFTVGTKLSSYIGGLIGSYFNSQELSNSYSSASIQSTGTNYVGGLVGSKSGSSTPSQSFYDLQKSGNIASAGGTGKTTAEMQQQATFTGWDFDKVWRMDAGYPFLRALTKGAIVVDLSKLNVKANDVSKTYDGQAVSTLADLEKLNGFVVGSDKTGLTAIGLKNGDALCVSANLDCSNLQLGGTWKGAINANTYTIVPSGLSTQDYEVTYTNGALTILPKNINLTVSGTRVYDGTKDANASDNTKLTGILDADLGQVSLAGGGKGVLADKNVGLQNLVDKGTLALAGSQAGNYQLTTDGSVWTITPALLKIYPTVDSKTYDGTTTSDKVIGTYGLVGTDTVTGSQAFKEKNVLGKSLSTMVVSGYIVNDGNEGRNYFITTSNSFGTITQKEVYISGLQVQDKKYDGSDSAVITGAYLADAVNGDLVTVKQLYDPTFISKEVGNNIPVSNRWYLDGKDAENYRLTTETPVIAGNILSPDGAWNKFMYCVDSGCMQKNVVDSHVADNLVNIVNNVRNEVWGDWNDHFAKIGSDFFDARESHSNETGFYWVGDFVADVGTYSGQILRDSMLKAIEFSTGITVAKASLHQAIESAQGYYVMTDDEKNILKSSLDTTLDVISIAVSLHELKNSISTNSVNNWKNILNGNPVANKLLADGKLVLSKDGVPKLSSQLGIVLKTAMKKQSFKNTLDSISIAASAYDLIDDAYNLDTLPKKDADDFSIYIEAMKHFD